MASKAQRMDKFMGLFSVPEPFFFTKIPTHFANGMTDRSLSLGIGTITPFSASFVSNSPPSPALSIHSKCRLMPFSSKKGEEGGVEVALINLTSRLAHSVFMPSVHIPGGANCIQHMPMPAANARQWIEFAQMEWRGGGASISACPNYPLIFLLKTARKYSAL